MVLRGMREVVRYRGQLSTASEGKTTQEKVCSGHVLLRHVTLWAAYLVSKLICLLLHRVKQLREEPYTQKEAEAAVGLGTNNEDPYQANETTEDEIEMAT